MFFRPREADVLIVGAGPVGLFTALTLAQRGLHPIIIDRHRRTNIHSYALALHPSSLHLFDGVGISGELIDKGQRIHTQGFYEGETVRGVLSLSALETPHPYALVLPQSELERTLEAALERQGIRVRWDHELTAIEQDDTGVFARVSEYSDIPQGYPVLRMHRMVTGEHTYHAKYVIGADGYHSMVRASLPASYDQVGMDEVFSVYEVRTPMNLDHEVRVVLHGGLASVLWPMPNDKARWSFQLPSPREYSPTPERLAELCEDRAPWFELETAELEWTSLVHFQKRLVNTFGRDRIWLAGDAAHLTGPIGAQSMNCGLTEAFELGWRLFEILRNNASPNLLQIYDANRRQEWSRLLGVSGQLVPDAGCDGWIAQNAERVRSCVPASGAHFESLLASAGLTPV
jgi:2-polyprenyl-6-methoxyphenol hydroxylase-like FAD-dependent oxidoreductase